MEPQQPHEALFLSLAYLNLFELLSMSEVCRSIREAINDDSLLWLDILFDRPLNFRVKDDILFKITSKANGRLRSLSMINCVGITDDGLQRVIENNPYITKLCVPGCTGLTSDGIVRLVKTLTDQNVGNKNLKYLKLNGIYNITKEHLGLLYSYLNINPNNLHYQNYKFFHQQRYHFSQFKNENDDNDKTSIPIDVEICPRCDDVKLVFDCPRERCRTKRDIVLTECRGCSVCISRCEGCGGCMNEQDEEMEETVCMDVLCLNCWLQMPKCNLCNKPYCPRHADDYYSSRRDDGCSSNGFICDVCISMNTMEEAILE